MPLLNLNCHVWRRSDVVKWGIYTPDRGPRVFSTGTPQVVLQEGEYEVEGILCTTLTIAIVCFALLTGP